MVQNKKLFSIAIDFDGTIALNGFPDITKAKINSDFIYLLEQTKSFIKSIGLKPIIILWTCRTNNSKGSYLSDAVEFCKKHKIHIDYVNENPTYQLKMFENVKIYTPSPKIYADLYLDDLAYNANEYFLHEIYQKYKK